MRGYRYFLIAFTIAHSFSAAAIAAEDYEMIEASSGDIPVFTERVSRAAEPVESKTDLQAIRDEKMSGLASEIKSMSSDMAMSGMDRRHVEDPGIMSSVMTAAYSYAQYDPPPSDKQSP